MERDWYKDFFQGIVVEMWRKAVSPVRRGKEKVDEAAFGSADSPKLALHFVQPHSDSCCQIETSHLAADGDPERVVRLVLQ